MTQEQVFLAFEHGHTRAKASNLFIQGDTLFSRYDAYDPFPLAVRVDADVMAKDRLRDMGISTAANREKIILLNGDLPANRGQRGGWGNSSSGNWVTPEHQRMTFNHTTFRNLPRVPFSVLREDMANLPFDTLAVSDFVTDTTGEWRGYSDTDGNWVRNEQGDLVDEAGKSADEAIPIGAQRQITQVCTRGAVNYSTSRPENVPTYLGEVERQARIGRKEPTAIRWHRIGSSVLRAQWASPDSNRYLCSMDENTYFVSRLPGAPITVADAFMALKPKAVQEWEASKRASAKRQGEWFFLELTNVEHMVVPVRALRTPYDLPHREESNIHRASEGFTLEPDAVEQLRTDGNKPDSLAELLNTRGTVVHVRPDGVTPSREHADLNLGTEWHQAWKNTSLGDWTIPGNMNRGPMVD